METIEWNNPSGSISVHQPSLGIGKAVLDSVTHSNTAYHDNRLTDDWSVSHTPVSDLTAVWVSSLSQYFDNPASPGVLHSKPVNEQTWIAPADPAVGQHRSPDDTLPTPIPRKHHSSSLRPAVCLFYCILWILYVWICQSCCLYQ